MKCINLCYSCRLRYLLKLESVVTVLSRIFVLVAGVTIFLVITFRVHYCKMPSIFNHENSCWGVKRSFCNVFQYDFNEELQSRKLTELGLAPNSSTDRGNANYVHYSVSSNGYYGYQPHNIPQAQKNDDNVMEIEENNIVHTRPAVPDGNTNMFGCNILTSHLQNVRRKRHISEDCVESNKRLRQEEAEPELKTFIQESHQCDGGGSRVDSREGELLRQTHGCELYLYERGCDY